MARVVGLVPNGAGGNASTAVRTVELEFGHRTSRGDQEANQVRIGPFIRATANA